MGRVSRNLASVGVQSHCPAVIQAITLEIRCLDPDGNVYTTFTRRFESRTEVEDPRLSPGERKSFTVGFIDLTKKGLPEPRSIQARIVKLQIRRDQKNLLKPAG